MNHAPANHHHQHLDVLTAGLAPEEVKRILAVGRRVDARPGQTIFRTGDAALNMFLVVHGLLKAEYHEDESDRPMRYLRPGDHFGIEVDRHGVNIGQSLHGGLTSTGDIELLNLSHVI